MRNTIGFRTAWAVAAAVAAVLSAASAQAQAPAPAPGIDVTGFVDTYYSHNFNDPVTRANSLHVFDVDEDAFALSLAEVAFEKKPVKDSPLGFRVDLDFGSAADISNSLEPGNPEILKNLQQAYVSWLPSPKLQLDLGKFVTFVGAEVVESKDNWNYTRSIQFGFAIPIYHAGVRAIVTPNDKVTIAGYLVNGWNNVVENNGSKTVGAQVIWKPSAKFTWIGGTLVGKEAPSTDTRVLFDTIFTFSPSSKLSLNANYDYGKDGDVMWQALSLYARLQANSKVALSPRFEWLDDDDGFMTIGSKATTFTLTGEVKIAGGLLTRVDLRYDNADRAVFASDVANLFKKNQTTVTLGVVYAFAGKI